MKSHAGWRLVANVSKQDHNNQSIQYVKWHQWGYDCDVLCLLCEAFLYFQSNSLYCMWLEENRNTFWVAPFSLEGRYRSAAQIKSQQRPSTSLTPAILSLFFSLGVPILLINGSHQLHMATPQVNIITLQRIPDTSFNTATRSPMPASKWPPSDLQHLLQNGLQLIPKACFTTASTLPSIQSPKACFNMAST